MIGLIIGYIIWAVLVAGIVLMGYAIYLDETRK